MKGIVLNKLRLGELVVVYIYCRSNSGVSVRRIYEREIVVQNRGVQKRLRVHVSVIGPVVIKDDFLVNFWKTCPRRAVHLLRFNAAAVVRKILANQSRFLPDSLVSPVVQGHSNEETLPVVESGAIVQVGNKRVRVDISG